MSDFIGIALTGDKEIAEKLKNLPPYVQDEGVEAADEYIVNSLKQYPPYSYVPIQAVGGFKSDKQRRYVMAMIQSGEITPGKSNRTQRLAQGWKTVGKGKNQIVANEVPYAPYEYEISQQSQMHMLQGWQVLPEFLKQRTSEILRRFDAGVKNAIRKLGLG